MTRVAVAARATSSLLPLFRNETEFQRHVVKMARDNGWGITKGEDDKRDAQLASYNQPPDPLGGLVFHPRLMVGSEPGWPDLTLVRRADRRLIFAELKTDDGRVTPRQAKVLDLLRCLEGPGGIVPPLGPTIGVYVWRPRDLVSIEATLR